jgi:hypothetical protein
VEQDVGVQASDQGTRLGVDGHQPGNGLAVLRDHDIFRRDPIEQSQALGLELRSGDGLHDPPYDWSRIATT